MIAGCQAIEGVKRDWKNVMTCRDPVQYRRHSKMRCDEMPTRPRLQFAAVKAPLV